MSTLWFEQALLPGGWARDVRVAVGGGRITRLEAGVERAAGDEAHAAALPGIANVHSHTFQRGMAGLAEVRGPANDNFWTWREVMYRFVERMGPEEFEAIAATAFAEMLEGGFTRVGEFHYLHHGPGGAPYANPAEMTERVVAAADQTGIGLTLLPVFYAHSNFAGLDPKPGQRPFIHSVDSFAKLVDASRDAVSGLGDAVVGVAPHSLRAVTPDELTEVAKLTGGAPIHIHAAEQTKEVDDCVAWSGKRPVEWLLDHGVTQQWCLVHATHMTEAETTGLARRGAVAGLCPITEANLGDGIFPGPTFTAAGGHFGIGTDSNVLIAAAEELRALEYAQRLAHRSRNVMVAGEGASTGGALYRAALKGGAQATGVDGAGLAEGAPADFLTLDTNHPAMMGREGDALIDSWIFAARGGAVDCVWRRGKKVVTGGRHHARDAIVARYKAALKKVLN